MINTEIHILNKHVACGFNVLIQFNVLNVQFNRAFKGQYLINPCAREFKAEHELGKMEELSGRSLSM